MTPEAKPATCARCDKPAAFNNTCNDHFRELYLTKSSFSTRVDPTDPDIIITTYRHPRVNDVPGYHVTGDAHVAAVIHFCLHYLHSVGLLPDDFAADVAAAVGAMPLSEPLPWAAPAQPVAPPAPSPAAPPAPAVKAADEKTPPKREQPPPRRAPVTLVRSSVGDTVATMPDDDKDDA